MLVPWTLAACCCVVRFCGVQRCLFAQGKKTHHTFWLAPSAQTGKNSLGNSLALYSWSAFACGIWEHYVARQVQHHILYPCKERQHLHSTWPSRKQRIASRCIECDCNATSAIVSLCILCEPEPVQQPAAQLPNKDKQRPKLLSQHYHSANCISGVPIPCDWARSDSKCRDKVYSVSAKC